MKQFIGLLLVALSATTALAACGGGSSDPPELQPVVKGRLMNAVAADFVDREGYVYLCEFDAEVNTEGDVVAEVLRQGSNTPVKVGDKITGVPVQDIPPGEPGFVMLPVRWEAGQLTAGCAPESQRICPSARGSPDTSTETAAPRCAAP